MVLAAVVVLGILAEAATLMTSRLVQADREAELLFRGQAYRRAIKSHYEAGGPVKAFPRSLEDLLQDPRFPNKRHIRALYPDPVSRDGKKQWLLIRAPDGGIAGVASASRGEPLKKANFPKGLEKFEGAQSYADWIFEYTPQPVTQGPVPAGPPVLKTK
jgi:type II secretory pathway pseudopilin PulG